MLMATSGKYYRNGVEITREEYDRVLALMKQKPVAEEGYSYRFTDDDKWERYKVPVEEVENDLENQATEEDYQSALAELGVKL